MDSFLAYCSIWCILILATDGVRLTFEMKSIMPLKSSTLLFSCRTSELFESGAIAIRKGDLDVTNCYQELLYKCDYKSGYIFTANNTVVFGVISNLNKEDEGTWGCRYIPSGAADVYSNSWNLIVYTIPSGLSITQNPDQDVDLSVNSIVMHCKTTNCTYPMPTIKWIFKDQATLPETVYATVSAAVSQGLCTLSEMFYTSTLQIPQYTTFNDNSDKTGTFYCRIEYPDTSRNINSPSSKNIRFAVNVTSVTLKDTSGNPLPNIVNFVNGSPVTLFCVTSTSWPAATVIWFIDTMQITSGINNSLVGSNGLKYVESRLTLTPSNADHNKWIYCQAYTINKTYFQQSVKSQMFVKVKVEGITLYDSSSALVSSTLPVVDGTPTTLHCETTPSRPAAVISWYKGDFVINNNVISTNWTRDGLDIIRSSLNLTPANSDHGQYIYCQAYNIDPVDKVTSIRTTLQVTVYVKSITMSSSLSPLIFLEGQEKRIQCVTSPSRPRPQVRWWLGTQQVLDKIKESESSIGNLIVTTSVISLTLNRSHTHKVLYCDATVSGQQAWISSTKSHFTVQYVIVNVSGSMLVGSNAVLTCTAQGEPPQYTFHPWIHRVGQTEIRRLNGVNKDSISILTLSNISSQDMGSYICTVDNSITGLDGQLYQTGDTSVYVQGRPFIDEIQTSFTGDSFKPASIQIPFYSQTSIQKLTFIKQIGSLEILNTSDIYSYIQPSNITMMFYNKKVRIPGYVAVLQFRNLTETDFGNYTLKLTNDQGTETMQFEFITPVPPSMPKNFFFVHIDDGFMVFGLEKGFNGGHQQTFIVEYRTSGMSGAAWSTVYRINEDDLPNPSSNGTYYIKIPKLQDGQYEFGVYAENVKGNSSAIEGVHAEIKTEQPPVSGLQVGAVVGGVVGGVVGVLLLVIVVIFFMKRCKLNLKMKAYKREVNSTDHFRSAQLGPLYVNTSCDGDVSDTGYESLQAKSTTESPYQTIDKDPNNGGSETLAIRSQGSEKIYINTAIDSAYRDKEYEGLQLTQTDSHPYSQLSGKNKSTEM